MDKQKGLAPILIILLIALAVGGYLLYQKQTKPTVAPQPVTQSSPSPVTSPTSIASTNTANWKTYKDPYGLFSLKYPQDKNINVHRKDFNEKSNPRPKWLLTDVAVDYTYKPGSTIENGIEPFSLSLWVSENNDNLTGEKQEESIKKGPCPETLKPYKNGEIDGIEFIRCIETSKGIDRLQEIIYITKAKIYTFSLGGLSGEGADVTGKTREYVDKILSTFKFLDQTETNETADWKTYTTEGFSFNYPSGWSVESRADDYFKGQVIVVRNPKKSVVLTITPRQYPYGFEGSQKEWGELKTNNLKIAVNGVTYEVKENLMGQSRAYVDFQVHKNQQTYFILFGTGYPAGKDSLASLSDYNFSKSIILEILSTFKFTQ